MSDRKGVRFIKNPPGYSTDIGDEAIFCRTVEIRMSGNVRKAASHKVTEFRHFSVVEICSKGGHDRIYTAGEKEYLASIKRKDTGVPVNDSVQKELIAVRDELGLTQYRFPFE